MVSSVAAISLNEKANFDMSGGEQTASRSSAAHATSKRIRDERSVTFLRIPPFPGAKTRIFAEVPCAGADASDLVDEVRSLRVGGAYWGAQPELPTDHVLVRSSGALTACAGFFEEESIVFWADRLQPPGRSVGTVVSGECDPWHMLSSASAVVTEHGDELQLIAALGK